MTVHAENVHQLFLREVIRADLAVIAEVHTRAFPNSALTKLGKGAVARYYEWLLEGPHNSFGTVVLNSNGQAIGFCFGGKFKGALAGFLAKNRLFLTGAIFLRPWLVFNDIIRNRLRTVLVRFVPVRTGRKTSNHLAETSEFGTQFTTTWAAQKSFCILAIATHPEARRLGVGRELMRHMEELALSLRFEWMDLSVDPRNSGAVAFYKRLGWVPKNGQELGQGLMVKRIQHI